MERSSRKKRVKRVLVAFALVIGLPLAGFGVYSSLYYQRVYAAQYVGADSVSGMTRSDLKNLLEKKGNEVMAYGIVLHYQNGDNKKDYTIKPEEIGLHYNLDDSVASVWQVGRDGSAFREMLAQIKTLFSPDRHQASYSLNESMLNDKIAAVAKEIDSPEKDYSIKFANGKFSLNTERAPGKRINQDQIKLGIGNHLGSFELVDLSFESITYNPQVSEDKASNRLEEAKKIADLGDLILAYDNQQHKLDVETIGGIVKSRTKGDDLELYFDTDRISTFVDSLASSVDIDPGNAKLKMDGGRVNVFQPAMVGKTLNRTQTIEDIKQALVSRISRNDLSQPQTINLVVAEKQPEISESSISSLGITELISTGVTNFKGSPANRQHNIQVGAAALNGILIKPGETFSTLAKLGEINDKAGYLPELVIKENETVPEFGGGLCQVSTTLFRAALNAGLKITERQNHKYRVSYYEPPVGMDATIYDPAPDFKFINNYAGYILVQSKVEGTKITFELYGTKDSRQIEVGESETWDPVDPGPPVEVETDTLAPGERKQVEKAHAGISARFHYKVTKDGQKLQDTTFTSKYVPWPEKWLVGKQPVATPAAPTDAAAPVTDPAAQPAT